MIRVNTIKDIPQLMVLAKKMHEEGPYADISFNPVKVEALFRLSALRQSKPHICFVAEEGETLIGFFLGLIIGYFFGDEILVQDRCLYVIPEKRGNATGMRLLHAVEKEGMRYSARESAMGISLGFKTAERTAKILERQGYILAGHWYKKQLR